MLLTINPTKNKVKHPLMAQSKKNGFIVVHLLKAKKVLQG